MKWWSLFPPPVPAHLSKEQRKLILEEVRRLNRSSWKVGIAFMVLLVCCALVDAEHPMSVLAIPVGVLVANLIARRTVRINSRKVWLIHLLCPNCGYDLREIQSERCPECGIEFKIERKNVKSP